MKLYDAKAITWNLPVHDDFTKDKEMNPYIVETAGFVPLDVQIQKFEQAGVRARFRSDMFDSSDYRDMYLNEDLRINPSDDEIDVERKIKLQNFVKNKILEAKSRGSEKQSVESLKREYEALKRREAELRAQVEAEKTPTPPAASAES